MRLRRIIPVLSLFFSVQAHAGAWTQAEGEGLFIAQATYFSSDHFFDFDGLRVKQSTFRKAELQPYAEYGLRDWLTIGGSAYVQYMAQAGDDNQGIGDPELFARVRLKTWENGDVLSIQPLVKLPSYYMKDNLPRGGSRSIDGELALLYGSSWNYFGITGYTDTKFAYRMRSRGLKPQYRVDQAIGINITDDFLLIPAVRSVITTEYDDTAAFSQDGEQDYDLAKAEVTALYKFDEKRWVHATYFDHIAGAFTGDGRGITIGYAERF